jgi:hypothetical protein
MGWGGIRRGAGSETMAAAGGGAARVGMEHELCWRGATRAVGPASPAPTAATPPHPGSGGPARSRPGARVGCGPAVAGTTWRARTSAWDCGGDCMQTTCRTRVFSCGAKLRASKSPGGVRSHRARRQRSANQGGVAPTHSHEPAPCPPRGQAPRWSVFPAAQARPPVCTGSERVGRGRTSRLGTREG